MPDHVKELLSIQQIHDEDETGLNDLRKDFLSIELSPGGFSYCVLNTQKFKYTTLESFKFEDIKSFDTLAEVLEALVKSRKSLTQTYQRISLVFSHPVSTLIPAHLFSYSEKNQYLGFHTYPDNENEIRVDKLNNLVAYSVYSFPKTLSQKINFLFPGCRIRHISTTLIENILYMNRYQEIDIQLALHIQNDHFEILIFKEKNLVFYNSFRYQTWDDLFYYLFFVLEQMRLEAEDLHTLILGEVSINSTFYKQARLYFKSLHLASRTDLYKYALEFDSIPHHYYFNLLNLNACG